MSMVELDAELVKAGDLDGTEVTVRVDLLGLLENVPAKAIIDEIEERASANDGDVLAFYATVADEYADEPDEPDLEPWFERMSEWDRDELRKAVRLDDGRRAIDLLKRALTDA